MTRTCVEVTSCRGLNNHQYGGPIFLAWPYYRVPEIWFKMNLFIIQVCTLLGLMVSTTLIQQEKWKSLVFIEGPCA